MVRLDEYSGKEKIDQDAFRKVGNEGDKRDKLSIIINGTADRKAMLSIHA